jgi:hypothetical protein
MGEAHLIDIDVMTEAPRRYIPLQCCVWLLLGHRPSFSLPCTPHTGQHRL